jgi:hypothetical protein
LFVRNEKRINEKRSSFGDILLQTPFLGPRVCSRHIKVTL